MATTGTSTLDFGTGVPEISLAVTGQAGITGTSLVDAWVIPKATTNHSVDEHRVEGLEITAGNIVAGTGFTIYGQPLGPYKLYGQFNIGWVWN